ncbi:hypothetical protein EON65_08945 [archaeon]|nr:MAG: hypothetical protein EON65_08945 [archaeon]
MINYVNLNWVFPVDASSTVTITLVSKDTVLIGVVELEVARIAKIPPNLRGFREVSLSSVVYCGDFFIFYKHPFCVL